MSEETWTSVVRALTGVDTIVLRSIERQEAEPLACVNQVISYRSLVENVEPGSGVELEQMDAYWARKALDAAEAQA